MTPECYVSIEATIPHEEFQFYFAVKMSWMCLLFLVVVLNVSNGQCKQVTCYIRLSGTLVPHRPQCAGGSATIHLSKSGTASATSSLPDTALCSDLRNQAETSIESRFPSDCAKYVKFSPTTGGCNCIL